MSIIGHLAAILMFFSLAAGAGGRLVQNGTLNTDYFDLIRSRVAEERGLNWVKPVQVEIVNKEQVRKFIGDEIDEEYPPEKIEALNRAYIRMGLLDPGTDLKAALVDFVTFAGAGFYDSEVGKLFLVSDAVEPKGLFGRPSKDNTAAELVVAHELEHALDDQHFDLEKLIHPEEPNDDAATAVSALVEGTASIVGFAVIYRPGMDMEELFSSVQFLNRLNARLFGIVSRSTPQVIRETLLFSYDAGSTFVAQLYRINGNWSAVNDAFNRPPASTEQVMHPEKYIRDDDPPVIPQMDVKAETFGKDWTEIDRNTMGEFGTLLLLKRFMGKKAATIASEGWGGDRYVVFEGPDMKPFIWIWSTVWDSGLDASEFKEAYMKVLKKKYRRLKLVAENPENTFLYKSRDGELVLIRTEDREVLIIESSGAKAMSAAAAEPL